MNNCDSVCNLAVVLLGLLVIMLCLRYYYINRESENENKESFSDHNNSLNNKLKNPHQKPETSYPCSPENFKVSLYEFYKSAEKYRNGEKELKDAQLNYEDKYQIFHKNQQELNFHKNRIGQCIDR